MTQLRNSSSSGTVLFDGVCNFCNGWVRFIINRDPKKYFYFASLQSKVADELLAKHGMNTSLDSIVLLENDQYYSESTAVLRICKKLTGLWKLLYVFIIIPKPVRDFFYRWFAKNRYRFFGKSETCMLPTPEVRERFLEMSS